MNHWLSLHELHETQNGTENVRHEFLKRDFVIFVKSVETLQINLDTSMWHSKKQSEFRILEKNETMSI